MAKLGRVINDLIVGEAYSLYRDQLNIAAGRKIVSAQFLLKNNSNDLDSAALITLNIVEAEESAGQILDNAATTGKVKLKLNLTATQTSSLAALGSYYYSIKIQDDQGTTTTLETGTLVPQSTLTANKARATSARALGIVSNRENQIINQYVDTILHDFRQLKVWDEHARRSGTDPLLLRLTYKHLNPEFYPEVYTGFNERLNSNQYSLNYEEGTLQVQDDPESEDYFVTYEFDYFPPEELQTMLELTLQELNVAGTANGGYITNYATVDQAPPYWDAALTFGTVAKAFKRLATESGLWKNYLIWVNDNNGPSLAKEAADYYQLQFENFGNGLKRLKLIGAATQAYQLFQSIGFGNYSLSTKFRELTVNKMSIY